MAPIGGSRYDRIVQAPAAATATAAGKAVGQARDQGAPVERWRKVGDPRPTAAPAPTVAPAIGPEVDGAEAGGREEPAGAEAALERKRRKRREEAAAKAASKARTPAAPAASPLNKRPREVSALDSFFTNGPRLQPASPDVPRRSSR